MRDHVEGYLPRCAHPTGIVCNQLDLAAAVKHRCVQPLQQVRAAFLPAPQPEQTCPRAALDRDVAKNPGEEDLCCNNRLHAYFRHVKALAAAAVHGAGCLELTVLA
jgi:hypothetical protein